MDIKDIMTRGKFDILDVDGMSEQQRKCLMDFTLKIYEMGQHAIGYLVDIKYDAQFIALDNGNR